MHRLKALPFFKTSRLAVGPTQPTIQWKMAALSPGTKWLGHKADHPLSFNAEVKKEQSTYTLYHAEVQSLTVRFYV
jgi:hypothetical protein